MDFVCLPNLPHPLHHSPITSYKSFHLELPSQVPFLESPKYVPGRRESAHTLPLPSLHSHPLLRANSDNSVPQSDLMGLPSKAATNPNPGQV